MTQRQLIISALAKVGPEIAKRMTRAFGDFVPLGGWWDDPWAYAYGERGALCEDKGFLTTIVAGDEEQEILAVTPEIVGALFNVSVDEVVAVCRAFDESWNSEVGRAELFQLVKQEAMGRAVA